MNELSKELQNQAMSKDWYIYYKFTDENTGKLKRMPNIKGGCNRYKTKKERIKILTHLRDALECLLEKGLNPYLDSDLSILELENPSLENNKSHIPIPTMNEILVIPEPIKEELVKPQEAVLSIKEAFDHALKIKKKSLNDTSYINFAGRVNRFKKALDENALTLALASTRLSYTLWSP